MLPGGRLLGSLVRRLVPSGGLTERTVKSGIWAGLINVSDRLIQLGVVIVLARLLDPEAFGVMGIALIVTSAMQEFSRLGFDAALIHRTEEDIDEFLDTTWTVQLVRGVALGAIVFLVAPLVAAVFDTPRVEGLLRVIALSPVISGLQNPGMVYFQKNLEFHKRFVYSTGGQLANAVVAVGYALVNPSVWALVFGFLAADVMKSLVSYLIHSYRPRPEFDRERATELFGYGKWLLGSSAVGFLFNQGDDAFVGWYLGASALGLYRLAYRFSNAPATEISHVISETVFASYSKLQNDTAALRRGFFTTLRASTLVSFPSGIGLIVVAPLFVPVFLGPQWSHMVRPMQILAVYGVIRSFRSPASPLFKAVGRPDLQTKLKALKLVLMAVLIFPASARYGLVGTAFAIVANTLVAAPIACYLALVLVDGSTRRFASILFYPLAGSVLMGAGVFALREQLTLPPFIELPVLVAAGIVLYAGVMLAVDRHVDFGVRELVRTIRDAVG